MLALSFNVVVLKTPYLDFTIVHAVNSKEMLNSNLQEASNCMTDGSCVYGSFTHQIPKFPTMEWEIHFGNAVNVKLNCIRQISDNCIGLAMMLLLLRFFNQA